MEKKTTKRKKARTTSTTKKLTKNSKDKMVSGVISGFAEFFDIDTTLLRIGYIIFVAFTGFFPGVVAYIAAMMVMPESKK